jgi:hypothetical protein
LILDNYLINFKLSIELTQCHKLSSIGVMSILKKPIAIELSTK